MKHESGAVLTITDMKIADSGTYHCMVIVDTNTSAKSDIVQLSTTDTFIPDASELAISRIFVIFNPNDF